MNQYTFTGNLGRDAEVRKIEGGSSVIGFTVAITEKWKDAQGVQKENTTWVQCSKWVKAGGSTAVAQYLRKGTRVLVTGKPSARAYQAQDGSEIRSSLEVRVDQLELLGQPAQAGAPQAGPAADTRPYAQQVGMPRTATPADITEPVDDLPF